MPKLISLIVPVYNEAKNIPLLLAELDKVFAALPQYEAEFLFVNDGSQDDSRAVIHKAAASDRRIKYLELSRNFGKEIATTAGFHFSRGDAVIMIDADLQHPPKLIPEFIAKWEAGAEVVIGIRQKTEAKLVKKVGSFLFYKLINNLAAIKVIPYATDFRLLDRIVVDEFNGFTERNRMTRGLINWLGFKRDFVYFEADARANGAASYNFGKLCGLAMNSIISLSLKPLKFSGILGVIIIMLCGPFGLYVLIGKYLMGWDFASSFSGSAQLAILLVFLVGIILSCQGLMALYIANIHSEVLNRPLYVLRKKENIL